MIVLPTFRSCYPLKWQLMSLLISQGIFAMLTEQNIGADSCYIDVGEGKGIPSL